MPTLLRKGENRPIPDGELRVSVTGTGAPPDVSGLVLDGSGMVRGDADFVFYNQPTHARSAVWLTERRGTPPTVSFDGGNVEAEVQRVVVAATTDHDTFAASQPLRVGIEHPEGRFEFLVEPQGTERGLLLVEFYRRDAGWRVRAIGQGYREGLAAIAREHGVDIEEADGQDHAPRSVAAPSASREVPAAPSSEAPWPTPPAPTSETRGAARPGDGTTSCMRCGQPLVATGLLRKRVRGPRCTSCEQELANLRTTWVAAVDEGLGRHGLTPAVLAPLYAAYQETGLGSAADAHAAAAKPAAAALKGLVLELRTGGRPFEECLQRFDDAAGCPSIRPDTARHLRAGLERDLREVERRRVRTEALRRAREGDVPTVVLAGLHLDSGEMAHFVEGASSTRWLKSGPRVDAGQLVVSNKKVRFLGAGSGFEVSLSKISGVRMEAGAVRLQTSTARGELHFRCRDPEWTEALITGVLLVSNRRAGVASASTRSIPQHVRTTVWQRDGGRCVQCGLAHALEYDHVIPFSLGGASTENNLQLLCRECNLRKAARI